MTPIILTPKKVPILHSELTPKNGVTVTLYVLQCSYMRLRSECKEAHIGKRMHLTTETVAVHAQKL